MNLIEERALKKYPMWTEEYEAFSRSNRPYLREGYIKACEEYESLPKIHGWVARDKDGQIWAHNTKPIRWPSKDAREWLGNGFFELPKEMFPEITWESEPVEVELIIRKV